MTQYYWTGSPEYTRQEVIYALKSTLRNAPLARKHFRVFRALANAMREGQEAWIDLHGIPKWTKPAKGGTAIWIIPAPKVRP